MGIQGLRIHPWLLIRGAGASSLHRIFGRTLQSKGCWLSPDITGWGIAGYHIWGLPRGRESGEKSYGIHPFTKRIREERACVQPSYLLRISLTPGRHAFGLW